METLSPQEITRLLADWNAGDAEALERRAPLVYAELRRIARRQMGGAREGHTLQAAALVNEACLRLAGTSFTRSRPSSRRGTRVTFRRPSSSRSAGGRSSAGGFWRISADEGPDGTV